MGKYPPKAGDGAQTTLPHSWGSTRRRRGWGPNNSSPLMGKYPPKAGDGAPNNSSPFMGKYPPKAGDGAPITLPHSWGSTRRRRGKGQKKLFPIHGEVPALRGPRGVEDSVG